MEAFIEVMKEFGNQIIVGLSSLGIMTMILIAIKYFKPIFENVIKPAFDLFRKETKETLTPMENKFDTILEYLAFDAKTRSENPTLTKYNKEKYKEFVSKIITFVQENISNPSMSLKWIAENQLYMNVDYVSREFAKETGMTPTNNIKYMKEGN